MGQEFKFHLECLFAIQFAMEDWGLNSYVFFYQPSLGNDCDAMG